MRHISGITLLVSFCPMRLLESVLAVAPSAAILIKKKPEILRNNVYVNPKGEKFASVFGQTLNFDGTEKEMLKKYVNEEEPTVVYMPRPGYTF